MIIFPPPFDFVKIDKFLLGTHRIRLLSSFTRTLSICLNDEMQTTECFYAVPLGNVISFYFPLPVTERHKFNYRSEVQVPVSPVRFIKSTCLRGSSTQTVSTCL